MRLADVLLGRAQDIVSGGGGAGGIALDIRIVCPQVAGHLAVAAREALGAAEDYVKSKCARGTLRAAALRLGSSPTDDV